MNSSFKFKDHFKSIISILFLVTCCISCSSVPQPSGYPFTSMGKMQSISHWQILAIDVAEQIDLKLSEMHISSGSSLYIEERQGAFYQIFRKLLISSLVERTMHHDSQFTISLSRENSYIVQVDAQVLRHSSNRMQQLPPGAITIAGTVVKVLYDIGASASDLIIPVAALVDIGLSSYSSVTHNEVVISTAIIDKDAYLFTRSDIYYINDTDTDHYATDGPNQTPTRSFTGRDLVQ